MDATTSPSITARVMPLGSFPGLRLLVGILDSESVSMNANKNTVILLLRVAGNISFGNQPPRFVISEIMSAALIMNALLHRSVLGFIKLGDYFELYVSLVNRFHIT